MDGRYRGLLFDLWNTLVVSDSAVNPVVELGRRLERAGAADWKGALERGMMTAPLPGIAEALPSVEAAAGVRLSPGERRRAARAWTLSCRRIRIFPEVPAALDRLGRFYRLGLISNTQSFDMDFLDASGLAARFDVFHPSWKTGLLKPDPRAFTGAAGEMALPAGDVLMVGDSLADDIAGARAAGLEALLIRRRGGTPSHAEPPGVEPFIETLEDLEEMLRPGSGHRSTP